MAALGRILTVRFDVGGPVHPSRGGPAGIDGALRLQPVYSSVRIIAEGVAMLPLHQFRDLGDKRAKIAPGQLLSKPSAFINVFDWLFQYVLVRGADRDGMGPEDHPRRLRQPHVDRVAAAGGHARGGPEAVQPGEGEDLLRRPADRPG